MVPDSSVTVKRGAIAPWAKSTSPYYGQTLDALAKHFGFSLTKPWADLPEKARNVILYGSGSESIAFRYDDGLRSYEVKKPFEGVVINLERRYKRPTATGRARRSGASCPRRPASPATATG